MTVSEQVKVKSQEDSSALDVAQRPLNYAEAKARAKSLCFWCSNR